MQRLVLLLLPLAAACSQGGAPNDEGTAFDLRCFLVLGQMAESGPADTRTQALTAAIYFLGRIDGRDPEFDLEARSESEGAALRGPDAEQLVQRCGAEMQRRGAEVTAIGQRITEREKARSRR